MDIDTNLFEDEIETTEVMSEVEKAEKEIAGTVALFKASPDIPDAEEVGRSRATAARVMQMARDLIVKDMESYEHGCKLATACTVAIQAVEKPAAESKMAKVQEQRENAHSLHKFFTGLISSLVDPYKDARKMIDGKTGKWHREEVERRRVEAEKKRREEEKAREDEKLRLAIELEKKGGKDAKAEAEAILDEPVYVPPVEVVAPKMEGSTHVPRWTYEVVDLMALVRAVAEGKENASLLCLNTTLIGQMARTQKEAARVTGIRFYDAGTVRHA